MVLSQDLIRQFKEAALSAGKGCDFPECGNVSLGFACVGCARRLCNRHLYFKVEGMAAPRPTCPACILAEHESELMVDE